MQQFEIGLNMDKKETPSTNAEVPVFPTPSSRQEVVDQIKVLLNGQPEKIKDKIDQLKQTYYKLQKTNATASASQTKNEGEADINGKEPDPLETELKTLLATWKNKKAQMLVEQEKLKQDNLKKKLSIIEAIQHLPESSENVGKIINDFRSLQQDWKDAGQAPVDQENDLWKKYQYQVECFYDWVKISNDFRDYDFKKNLEIKTHLCASAEKLAEESDVVVAFRQLQKLHEEWRETGPVEKEIREDIWNRFKTASAVVNKNHQQFFERLKLAENENLARKTAICEQIEAMDLTRLKTYKDWDQATAEVISLQEQWKTIGFAPKKVNNKIFDRFRTACDRFFNLKSTFYKEAKDILNQNLEKKKELCEKAESLKESTDWKSTQDVLIQIQKEWKTIGPVPKKASDAIWKRFISACDYFFEQKEKHVPSPKKEEAQNLEIKQSLIAQMNALTEEAEAEKASETFHQLMKQWNATGHVPFKEKDAIYMAWHEAVDKQAGRLNVQKEKKRLNRFQQNLEDMGQKGQGKVLYERDKLMRQFEHLKNEIKTAENNIGFFTTSKSSKNNLLDQMNRKIEDLKTERDLIYKKIQLIDEQL